MGRGGEGRGIKIAVYGRGEGGLPGVLYPHPQREGKKTYPAFAKVMSDNRKSKKIVVVDYHDLVLLLRLCGLTCETDSMA